MVEVNSDNLDATTSFSTLKTLEAATVRQNGTRVAGTDGTSGWLWYAAQVLNDYLVTNLPEARNVSILELGSGTGWLALELARRGADVTATDRMGALPLLLQNVIAYQERLADVHSKTSFGSIEVQNLEWGNISTGSTSYLPGRWDLIIGSDILYMVEQYQGLVELIARHDFGTCVLAYEERKPHEESTFLDIAATWGLNVQVENATVNPSSMRPIWILRISRKVVASHYSYYPASTMAYEQQPQTYSAHQASTYQYNPYDTSSGAYSYTSSQPSSSWANYSYASTVPSSGYQNAYYQTAAVAAQQAIDYSSLMSSSASTPLYPASSTYQYSNYTSSHNPYEDNTSHGEATHQSMDESSNSQSS